MGRSDLLCGVLKPHAPFPNLQRNGQARRVRDRGDSPRLQRLSGGQSPACYNHVQRKRHAHKTAQALRTPCAGHKAQFHLGQAKLRLGACDTGPAGEGDLASATQCGPFQHRNGRDGKLCQPPQNIVEMRCFGRLAKFACIGSGN